MEDEYEEFFNAPVQYLITKHMPRALGICEGRFSVSTALMCFDAE